MILISFLLLMAQDQAPPAAPQHTCAEAAELLDSIEGLSFTEPPIFAIDTHLRTADALTRRCTGPARKWLHRAVELVAGVSDRTSASRFLVSIAGKWAALDLNEAEHVALRIPLYRDPEHDYRAEAYDLLARKAGSRQLEILERGLASGAFRSGLVLDLLKKYSSQDPQRTQALFVKLLAAYPEERGILEDAEYLAKAARSIAPWNPQLAEAAAVKVRRFRGEIQKEKAEASANINKGSPDLSGYPLREALERARKLEDTDRVESLIEISRRADAAAERSAIANEAIEHAQKLRSNEDRLTALSMLTHDFAKSGNRQDAVRTMQILAGAFAGLCNCDHHHCESLKGREDCADYISSFADYLDEEGLTPEALGIENQSLSVRMLVVQLDRFLNGKKTFLFNVDPPREPVPAPPPPE